MSFKRVVSLHDAERHGFWVEVTCPACRRSATFSPRSLIKALRPPYSLSSVAARMTCSDPPGCGHRGALIRPTDQIVSEKREPAVPVATNDRVPAGVDREAWAKADWHMRRRLIREARNR